jgi:hypothetical protein
LKDDPWFFRIDSWSRKTRGIPPLNYDLGTEDHPGSDLRLRAAILDPDQCVHSPGVSNPLATPSKNPDLIFASGLAAYRDLIVILILQDTAYHPASDPSTNGHPRCGM